MWSAQEGALHINLLEMRAKALITRAFSTHLCNRHVSFRGDNTTVTYAATSGTSRSPHLMAELRLLYDVLSEFNIQASESWLSTKANWEADGGRTSALAVMPYCTHGQQQVSMAMWKA